MRVLSVSSLPTGSVVWQPRRGAFALTVVCKATFRLVPGECVLAGAQERPSRDDRFESGDAASSLHAPGDLVPRKGCADVLLVGRAYAPGPRPVPSLTAWLVAGKVDKEIEVFGDRTLAPDGQLVEGGGFVEMPLRYERAAGGPGTSNPVGVRTGKGALGDIHGVLPLPNLEPPRRSAPSPGDLIEPIGFGPIPPTWPGRLLGRPDDGIVSLGRWRTEPLPDDFDFRRFNVAPLDQQLAELSGTERIVLQNLHPTLPRLVTRLPGLRPRALVQRAGQAPAEVEMRCDTLWIDTDRALCTLTWRGQVPLEAPDEAGRVLVALEEARGRRLDLHDVEALAPPFDEPPAEAPPPRPDPLPPPVAAPAPAIALSPPIPIPAWVPPVQPVEPPAPVPTSARAVRLLWFDRACMPRVRRAWQSLGAEARGEDEVDLLGFLGAGQPLDAAGLEAAMDAAAGALSCFRPPIVLLDGDLRFSFDARATLGATLIAAAPFTAGDPKLREAVGAVRELVQAPWFRASAGTAQELTRRLGASFAAANRTLPIDYLEAQAGRILLEHRRYQRRTLLQGEWIRATLALPEAEATLPAYLSPALIEVLPLFPSMPVRLLAEARPRQDQHEDHPVALRVVALGWMTGARTRPAGA